MELRNEYVECWLYSCQSTASIVADMPHLYLWTQDATKRLYKSCNVRRPRPKTSRSVITMRSVISRITRADAHYNLDHRLIMTQSFLLALGLNSHSPSNNDSLSLSNFGLSTSILRNRLARSKRQRLYTIESLSFESPMPKSVANLLVLHLRSAMLTSCRSLTSDHRQLRRIPRREQVLRRKLQGLRTWCRPLHLPYRL